MKTKDWSGKSSQVSRTSYDEEKQEMTVLFYNEKKKTTAKWAYRPVSLELWEESCNAVSIGKFLNVKIKPNCKALKLS